jgi:sporulation protein YlmC with PRC-barrel domain
LLGWISRPSAFGDRRRAWRLDQLRGLAEQELFVQGAGADTDQATVDRLPTLIGAALIGRDGEMVGRVVDATVDLDSGRIAHYLVARSDPRLPGSSRWRLSPDRIVDQQPGQVISAIEGLDDLPLARASVRQEFLRRSRRWRDQVQQAGDRFEDRLEGWLEEPPWEASTDDSGRGSAPARHTRPRPWQQDDGQDAWDDWLDTEPGADLQDSPEMDIRGYPSQEADPHRRRRRSTATEPDEDPWF